MKIHLHLVDQIAAALIEVFVEGKYASKIVERELKYQKKWGARDRRFFAEQLYGCVRWWRRLWFLIGESPEGTLNKETLKKIWLAHWLMQGCEIPENFPIQNLRLNRVETSDGLAISESIPDWMNKLGQNEMGERWPAIMKSLNQIASVDLRVNTLKIDRKKLIERLAREEIDVEPVENISTSITLKIRKNIFITQAYKDGLFEVQDRGSQQIASLLPVMPGDRVIDACAGAGGKTLHLAALMKNKGKIIALDIHDWKLKALHERAKRNGVQIVETRVIENSKTIKRLAESADGVLLDVPCSGMGVLRRNPDTKWKLSLEELEELKKTQREILSSYSQMVRPGGHLVYATCSFLKSENENQVESFLEKNSNWTLIKSLRIDPDQGDGDGFFAALLKRS